MTNLSGANLNNGAAVGPQGEGRESPSRFPTYPAYKNSGVEWLGEVPEHWVMGSLKNMAQIRNGRDYKEVESSDGEYPVIGSGGQFSNATQYLYEGESVLLGRKGTIDKPLYINGRFWTVDTMFYTEISKEACAKFFYYNSLTIPFGYYSTSTALPSMTQADLLNHPAAIPTKLEQTQIARFLDHETARIDALIEEQQRLIELLKEKRQAVISHAVTKGLDPTVPMKDSGVEWLGEVPAHWIVRKVSIDFQASKGPRGALLTKEYCHENPGEYPVYSGQTENGGVLGEIADYDFDLGAEGAILSTTVGAKAMSVMHVSGRISLSQNCMIIRPLSSDVKVGFYFYHLQPLFSLERRMIPDHMQPSFRMEDLYSFRVAVPPVGEQNQIADYLDSTVSRFDELIGEGVNGINLLLERRSALISAAVTGKIDVRGWQPPASTQTPEFEVAEAH